MNALTIIASVLLAIITGTISSVAAGQPYGEWRMEAPMPTPRGNPNLVGRDGLIYAVGGTVYTMNGPVPTGAVEVHDPSTGKWRACPTLPNGLVIMALGGSGGQILAVTGQYGPAGYGPATAIQSYDPETGDFKHVSDIPTPNSDPIVAFSDNKVIIMGGALPGVFKDHPGVLILDTETGEWTRGKDMPGGRHAGNTVAMGGRIVVLGGVRNFRDNIRDTIAYDPKDDSWYRQPSMPGVRAYFASAVSGGTIIIAGGLGDIKAGRREMLDSAYACSPETGAWMALPSLPVEWGHCKALVVNGRMYVMGGLVNGRTSGMVASIGLSGSPR